MAAVDNKHQLQILAVNLSEGKSKRTGNDWRMHKAQCVMQGPDGSVQVGELLLPKSMAHVPPGKYLAEFELGINYDRLVVPVLTQLHPSDPATKSAFAAATAAAGGTPPAPVARPAAQ